jgi:hypothetical protein
VKVGEKMRGLKSVVLATLTLGVALVSASAAKADILFGAGQAGQLYQIDTNNLGAFATLQTFTNANFTSLGGTSGLFLNSLALDESTQSLFFRNDSGSAGSSLFRYNIGTSTLTRVGTSSFGFASFNAAYYAGYYWTVGENSNTLYRIDTATGAQTAVSLGGANRGGFGDIAINQQTGELYGSHGGTFFKAQINNPTGTPTITGLSNTGSGQTARQISLNFDESFLWAQVTGTQQWSRVDKNTGATLQTLGSGQFAVNDLAGPRNRIPEPGAFALLGVGLAIGAVARRRRA